MKLSVLEFVKWKTLYPHLEFGELRRPFSNLQANGRRYTENEAVFKYVTLYLRQDPMDKSAFRMDPRPYAQERLIEAFIKNILSKI